MFHLVVATFMLAIVSVTALGALSLGGESFNNGVARAKTRAQIVADVPTTTDWTTAGSFR